MIETLISRWYLKEQVRLHQCGYYGSYSAKWAPSVVALARSLTANSILDYGCGHGNLVKEIRRIASDIDVSGYDPAVPEFAELPEPADLVVCTDVLEHIEPDKLAAVLKHLRAMTTRWMLAVIATRPATRLLSNGTNAHLLVKPATWWLPTLQRHGWHVVGLPIELPPHNPTLEYAALCQPRRPA